MDSRGMLHSRLPDRQLVLQGGWRNALANPLIASLGIPIMHTWNYSIGLWQFHHHYQVSNCVRCAVSLQKH